MFIARAFIYSAKISSPITLFPKRVFLKPVYELLLFFIELSNGQEAVDAVRRGPENIDRSPTEAFYLFRDWLASNEEAVSGIKNFLVELCLIDVIELFDPFLHLDRDQIVCVLALNIAEKVR